MKLGGFFCKAFYHYKGTQRRASQVAAIPCRIAVVSFADTAVQDTQLITSVTDLKAAVTSLTAGGDTNHADAFEKALQLFPAGSTNQKVMVMFTDGVTTAGGNPNTVATAAKAQGVVIYAIGLNGNGGIDEDLDVSGTGTGMCNKRTFNAKFIAHYIDSDFECCAVEE